MKKSSVILLHAGYWLVYLLIAAAFSRFMVELELQLNEGSRFNLFNFLFIIQYFTVSAIFGFYSAYYFLHRMFLARRRVAVLALAIPVACLISGSIGFSVMLFISSFWKMPHMETSFVLFNILLLSFIAFINSVTGLFLRAFITWYGDIRLKDELNRKNHEMEMALVKSRLSPHFLFNTLNNIDVLILRDPALASSYLNQLSDILRFMLYETKPDRIPLSREADFLQKYIALQRIRTSNPDYVKYTVSGSMQGQIAPMSLIPFVENAFKHAEHTSSGTAIEITLRTEDGMVYFTCENTIGHRTHGADDYHGLGDELVHRRLELAYPGRHTLTAEKKADRYIVSLTLPVT